MKQRVHEQVNLNQWLSIFPSLEGLIVDGNLIAPDQISSPEDLCQLELGRTWIRRRYDVEFLGDAAVDLFLWQKGEPEKPYLTKLGGAPYRDRNKPWPVDDTGKAYTFVAQFCFLDSRDILHVELPGDVLIIMFHRHDSHYHCQEKGEVYIEWSDVPVCFPIDRTQCPLPSFVVPELAGIIYRLKEYPNVISKLVSLDVNLAFAVSSSTRIGQETLFLQNDPRQQNEELICVLSAVGSCKPWSFLNMMQVDPNESKRGEHFEWGPNHMALGDAGSLYFLLATDGSIRCDFQCF
jgi:hypothetical protein